jgi:hypothetical protein
MGDEMRVRIIIESSVYKDAYLNQTFLERGAEETNDSLAKTYAFYSDEYSNEALSDGQIESVIPLASTTSSNLASLSFTAFSFSSFLVGWSIGSNVTK